MTVVTLAVTDFRLLIYLFIYYRFHRIPKNRFTQAKYHSSSDRNMSSRPALRHIKRSLICNSKSREWVILGRLYENPFSFPQRQIQDAQRRTVCALEKVETDSPSSDTGTTHVTLVKVPCCRLSYIPYVFKHCDRLVLKIKLMKMGWKYRLKHQEESEGAFLKDSKLGALA